MIDIFKDGLIEHHYTTFKQDPVEYKSFYIIELSDKIVHIIESVDINDVHEWKSIAVVDSMINAKFYIDFLWEEIE